MNFVVLCSFYGFIWIAKGVFFPVYLFLFIASFLAGSMVINVILLIYTFIYYIFFIYVYVFYRLVWLKWMQLQWFFLNTF